LKNKALHDYASSQILSPGAKNGKKNPGTLDFQGSGARCHPDSKVTQAIPLIEYLFIIMHIHTSNFF